MKRRTSLLALGTSLSLLLWSDHRAMATEPTTTTLATPANPLSDETAGKGADLTRIGHSPKDGSPYLGPQQALVVVNVFTDFQCPVCRRAADPIKQLVLDYPDKVKVVFRNNALSSHARAQAAALAAMAAGKQGKFWQYYDKLFVNPGALDDASLKQSASDLGLDVARWEKDLADPKSIDRIRRESDAAVRLGVPGTPGIFVNGVRQMGWGSYRDLHDTVGREIAAGETLASSGTKPADILASRIRTVADKNYKRDGEGAVNADDWVKLLLAD